MPHPTAVSRIAWSSDGSAIYFLASDEKSAEQQAREEEKDDVYAFEEDFEQQHLWTVTVSSGVTTRVTPSWRTTSPATGSRWPFIAARLRSSSIAMRARSG